MNFYRVESVSDSEDGPYAGMKLGYWNIHGNGPVKKNHPTPWDDGGLDECWIGGDFYFGFSDLKQFYRWFSQMKERKVLHKNGFVLTEYKARKNYVHVGNCQLVFDKNKAKPVKKYQIPVKRTEVLVEVGSEV